MRKTNVTLTAEENVFRSIMRIMKRSKAEVIQKRNLIDDENGVFGFELSAAVPTRRYRKVSAKLMKLADTVEVTAEA